MHERDRELAVERAEEDKRRDEAEMTTDLKTGERKKRTKRKAEGGGKRKKKGDFVQSDDESLTAKVNDAEGMESGEDDSLEKWLQDNEEKSISHVPPKIRKVAPSAKQALCNRDTLWNHHRKEVQGDTQRGKEHEILVSGKIIRKITFNNKMLAYTASIIGNAPDGGYPLFIALHGGGGVAKCQNDEQWEQMQCYYLRSVERGIYVAPRAVEDTWDCHFRPESYLLYERLIENFVAFDNVNPNKVYLLGFSAGGDGVYKISTRLADRFAAANMSAGHHNDTNPANLFCLPFCLQVGQFDCAYDRNKATVDFHGKLDELARLSPAQYIHETFVHDGKGHNFYDNHPTPQPVIRFPVKWAAENPNTTRLANTNAIDWVTKHTRNPYPKEVTWDLSTRADLRADAESLWGRPGHGLQHYWLATNKLPERIRNGPKITASYEISKNTIEVHDPLEYLEILVNGAMLELDQPVIVSIHYDQGKEQIEHLSVETRVGNQIETLMQRGDPNFIFEGKILLKRSPEGDWQVSSVTDNPS